MCGIFGIAAHDGRIPEGVLERGTQSLAHRGPDDSGTVVLTGSGNDRFEIGLGNRRLAILDLSPLAHQPMHDPTAGNWIVYNGEIYNFLEVRSELEKLGTSFTSHSDTEVLLKAYGRWGVQSLAKLRGMFAFAIWNSADRQLFLARDPMGIKPLYYAQAGSFFLFASEVRSLLGTGLVPKRISEAGLENYLTFGSAYDPLTPIQGIRSLPPGHWLTWQHGVVRLSQYWDLVDQPPPTAEAQTEPISESELKRTLEGAVREQLVSDVPVGIFLSGGIDSSALVSIVSRGGVTPSTFSIVFGESDFSEAQYSRAIAHRFHSDHHEITVSVNDVLAAVPDALRAMDLPTMDGINTYFVSREARRMGIKVALSGLGGDEVFAGYSSFRTVPRIERLAQVLNHLPAWARRSIAGAFAALRSESDQSRKLASVILGNGSVLHPYFVSRMLFTHEQTKLLLPVLNKTISEAATASRRDWLSRSLSLDPVNRISYLESRCYMLNTLLRDADFMSMSQGLEVRVPFLDHLLAKTVLALPGRRKLNRTPKKLLVEALEASLPDKIVHRPKRGFTLPFEHWMRNELRGEIEPVLQPQRIDDGPLSGLLKGSEVQRIWVDFLKGTVSWSRPWSLFVLQRWCELQSVSG